MYNDSVTACNNYSFGALTLNYGSFGEEQGLGRMINSYRGKVLAIN